MGPNFLWVWNVCNPDYKSFFKQLTPFTISHVTGLNVDDCSIAICVKIDKTQSNFCKKGKKGPTWFNINYIDIITLLCDFNCWIDLTFEGEDKDGTGQNLHSRLTFDGFKTKMLMHTTSLSSQPQGFLQSSAILSGPAPLSRKQQSIYLKKSTWSARSS